MVLRLKIQPGDYSVCRFEPTADPAQLLNLCSTSEFFSITRTRDEISVVRSSFAGEDTMRTTHGDCSYKIEAGWRLIKVEGPLDFGLVGIIHQISERLANAKVPLFVVSTFDTDYVLVKQDRLEDAVEALNHGNICVD
ncbi:hypothetical protein FBU59_003838 [Linderina macrospora]|uniref:Uncharacterized protein n=1 Tax=Linderina macrospora TaxID=4868 RepID=A0ACC1J7C6_9FUNG|nr:hypothetical protein FBU59_003838 [Linderina macrospora]